METRKSRDITHKSFSKDEALGQIAYLEQMVMQMGANDFEPSAFREINLQLKSGEITPDEAVARAQVILDSKQDYH